jgi:hypothetical protein
MKNFTIIHILLFILLMLVYQCAGAQDFLVTTKGDTVFGETKPIMFSNDKKVTVVDKDKNKTTYSIFQIRTFSSRNDTFVPVRTGTGYTFMKVVKAGYLSFLKFQLENQVTFDGHYLLKMDGQGIEVPNLAFRKVISTFLSDCPVVAERVRDGELKKNELLNIVNEYNACIDKRSEQQAQVSAQKKVVEEKINSWDVLETKLKAKADFQGKQDALDMITDIKSKINRKEKVPNFIIEALKSSLSGAAVDTELAAALKELQN